MTGTCWLTYKEIADRFGISRDAGKMLARRRGWPKQPTNRRGAEVRVGVPENFEMPEQGNSRNAGNAGTRSDQDHTIVPERVPLFCSDVPPIVAAQHHQNQPDQEQRHKEETERLLVTERALWLEREARTEQRHKEHVAQLMASHASAMALMLERVDAAECRAERVEERLDQILEQLLEQRRPWWKRVFGK